MSNSQKTATTMPREVGDEGGDNGADSRQRSPISSVATSSLPQNNSQSTMSDSEDETTATTLARDELGDSPTSLSGVAFSSLPQDNGQITMNILDEDDNDEEKKEDATKPPTVAVMVARDKRDALGLHVATAAATAADSGSFWDLQAAQLKSQNKRLNERQNDVLKHAAALLGKQRSLPGLPGLVATATSSAAPAEQRNDWHWKQSAYPTGEPLAVPKQRLVPRSSSPPTKGVRIAADEECSGLTITLPTPTAAAAAPEKKRAAAALETLPHAKKICATPPTTLQRNGQQRTGQTVVVTKTSLLPTHASSDADQEEDVEGDEPEAVQEDEEQEEADDEQEEKEDEEDVVGADGGGDDDDDNESGDGQEPPSNHVALLERIMNPKVQNRIDVTDPSQFDVADEIALSIPTDSKCLLAWLEARDNLVAYMNRYVCYVENSGKYLVKCSTRNESDGASLAERSTVIEVGKPSDRFAAAAVFTLDWEAVVRALAYFGVPTLTDVSRLVLRKAINVFDLWHKYGVTARGTVRETLFRPLPSPGLERVQAAFAAELRAQQSMEQERFRQFFNRWSGMANEYESCAHLYSPRHPHAWLRPVATHLWIAYVCICDRNWANFLHLMRHLATIVQRPYARFSSMVLVHGEPGCGKGMLFQMLVNIIGHAHATQLYRSEYELFGQFTGQLDDKVLVFADEYCEPKDPAKLQIIKGLISESTMVVRRMYCDAVAVPSYIKLVASTNRNEKVATTDPAARRYFILNAKPTALGVGLAGLFPAAGEPGALPNHKHVYDLAGEHAEHHQWLGVRAAALFYFRVDASSFAPRARAPHTVALMEQKEQNMDEFDSFMYTALCRGYYVRMLDQDAAAACIKAAKRCRNECDFDDVVVGAVEEKKDEQQQRVASSISSSASSSASASSLLPSTSSLMAALQNGTVAR